MEQCCGMDEFNYTGQWNGLGSCVVAKPCCKKQHGRADSFATAGEDIFPYLADKWNIRFQIFSELFFDLSELFSNKFQCCLHFFLSVTKF